MELAVADIYREDARRSCLQQTVGEAAGRCTHVRAIASRDDHAKLIERALQLLAAARHEARWAIHSKLRILVHLLSRFVVARNEAGQDEGVCLAPALREPSLDENRIEALFHRILTRSLSLHPSEGK
jgi:hypothetical protein